MKIKILTRKNGFSGVDVSVALVILMIFISLISVMFFNIYLSFTDSKRNSEATAYATQILEIAQKMYYQDVTEANLVQQISKMNIPRGYSVQIQINNYRGAEGNSDYDLVKNVIVTVHYKVGEQYKNIEFNTVKAKEILITPNKPKLEDNMVPVKYIIANRITNEGYWQITAEDDATWYSYENQRWATVSNMSGLTVEGKIAVTAENKKSLVGKKVENIGTLSVWIPRFAYKTSGRFGYADIEFLYSATNNYVDESGNMRDITRKGKLPSS